MRRLDLVTGAVTTVAGNYALRNDGVTGPPNNYGRADGVGTAASFYNPHDLALNSAGTFLLVVSGWGGGEPHDGLPLAKCARCACSG